MSRRFHHWIWLNEEGKKLYGEVFPTGQIPVVSMLPQIGGIAGHAEKIFLLYHEELSEEQLDKLLTLLSQKFNAPQEEIKQVMLKNRIPIREKYVSSSGTDHPGLFM